MWNSICTVDGHLLRTSTDRIYVMYFAPSAQRPTMLVVWKYARKDGIELGKTQKKRVGDLY